MDHSEAESSQIGQWQLPANCREAHLEDARRWRREQRGCASRVVGRVPPRNAGQGYDVAAQGVCLQAAASRESRGSRLAQLPAGSRCREGGRGAAAGTGRLSLLQTAAAVGYSDLSQTERGGSGGQHAGTPGRGWASTAGGTGA
jgi:hypothetical protein